MPKPAFAVVEKLFQQVVELPIDRRALFLADACGDDAELRAAVNELLRHDMSIAETNSFLVSPLTQAVDQLRPTQPSLPVDHTTPTIPGYHILGDIGRGGMGVVYMARQASLKRIVALKMLLPAGLAGTEQLARFKSEAELLARIHQPNIIPIYDVGEHEGRPYFTMEFVDGPDLAKFLAGRSQDPIVAAHVVEVLARAIHAVHEVGIVHRDLKPANVLLQIADKGSQGNKLSSGDTLWSATPKITDFGLAKDWNAQRDLTQTGITLGTPSYMAPEQARSRPAEIGPATDIYSLGAILYEMLTGRPPFDAATPAETIALLLRDDPLPPAQLKAGLPRDLTTICLKCLEKLPRKRYATANDLAEDLRLFQAGKPIHARPVSAIDRTIRWCRRHPLSAALAGLCGLLTVAFLTTAIVYDYHLEAALAREKELVALQSRQIVQLNVNIGVTYYEAGDTLAALLYLVNAMRHDDPTAQPIHRARLAELWRECPRLVEVQELQRLIQSARPTSKGLFAALVNNGMLEVRDDVINPNAKTTNLGARRFRALAVCPDGQWTARVGEDGKVEVVGEKGEPATSVILDDGPAITDVAIHRGGTALVTSHIDGSKRLWIKSEDRYSHRPLPPGGIGFAVSHCGKWWLSFDADGSGQLSEFTSGQSKALPKLGTKIDRAIVSADAERIMIIEKDQSVRIWHLATGDSIDIPHLANNITHAHFSHDGKRLLLVDGRRVIRVWDAITARRLTPLLWHNTSIVEADFNPDGNRVVSITQAGNIRIWELPGSTTAPARRWDPQCDTHSMEELIARIQILAHRRIDEKHQMTPLSADHVRATIERMKAN